MVKYQECTVRILIEKDSERYRRIQRIADAEGYSFDDTVAFAVATGVYHHIDQNLQLMERGIENRRKGRTGGE